MRVIIVSPPAANGICWLVNCLLELDVMCYYSGIDHTWCKKPKWSTVDISGLLWKKRKMPFFKQIYKLNNSIKKRIPKSISNEMNSSSVQAAMNLQEKPPWNREKRIALKLQHYLHYVQVQLPIFSRKKDFNFMTGLAVEWEHFYPQEKNPYDKVILFTRDPRDAIFSIYLRFLKHQFKDMTYAEFLDSPQKQNNLSYLDNYVFFHLAWLEQKNVLVVRFEDYKTDACATLAKVLNYLELDISQMEIEQAVANSTHVKAREAEERFYADNPDFFMPYNRANRSSTMNDFASYPEAVAAADRIYSATAGLLNRLGYSFKNAPPPPKLEDFLPRLPRNDWFDSLPAAIRERRV